MSLAGNLARYGARQTCDAWVDVPLCDPSRCLFSLACTASPWSHAGGQAASFRL